MNITVVVGARPNLMKGAPIVAALRARRPEWAVHMVHTGEDWDEHLAEVCFTQLGMARPDVALGVGTGTRTHVSAAIMLALEGRFRLQRPDAVIVLGADHTAFAASLVARQLRIPVAHVEAGLRVHDRDAPEEINRQLADALSDLLFVTERDAEENLRHEGIDGDRIHFVGNTSIDTLITHRKAARALCVPEALGLRPHRYVVVTLHRPSNVDSDEQLRSVVYALQSLADHTDVVFPAQPRVFQRLKDTNLWSDMDRHGRLRVINPLGYLEFLGLVDLAGAILTDSGGVQEEAVMLGVPCVTLRSHTDRPVTLLHGANRLAGNDPHLAVRYVCEALHARSGMAPIPEGWDGHAAGRIVDVLERVLTNGSDDRF
jgi:UDP-N-acetylglucosamine 2-epimerase (non-hydrolysing)